MPLYLCPKQCVSFSEISPWEGSESIVLFAQQFAEGLLALFLTASASKWILTVNSNLRLCGIYLLGAGTKINRATSMSETQLVVTCVSGTFLIERRRKNELMNDA
jgi:hypothetical protein